MATQQEVDNIIDSVIIDNTTGYINPARVRQVLKAINARIGNDNVASISVEEPITLDGFTGIIGFKKIPFKSFRVINKGWKPGTMPDEDHVNTTNESVLGDFCIGTDTEGYLCITRWVTGEGEDINDISNHVILLKLRQPLVGEPGFEE